METLTDIALISLYFGIAAYCLASVVVAAVVLTKIRRLRRFV